MFVKYIPFADEIAPLAEQRSKKLDPPPSSIKWSSYVRSLTAVELEGRKAMKKSSLGKRAVSGACALTLALSMPVLAFGTGDAEPVTDQQALAETVADAAASDTTLNGTTASTTINPNDSGLSVQPPVDENVEVTDNLEVTVDYTVDTEIDSQEKLDAAIEENGPVIEQVSTPSEAFDAIKSDPSKVEAAAGTDKDAAIDLISNPDNYISANTFKVNPVGQEAGATVTVVYAPDANAQSVECYVYYTYVKGGVTTNKVEKLTLNNGKYELTIDGTEAQVTFVLANSATSVATKGDTSGKITGSTADGYDWTYTTATVQAMLGNGQLNWSASASADVHQDDATAVPGNLAISEAANPSDAYTKQQGLEETHFDYAKVINLQVTSAAADDVSNAKITANVGAANRTVRVFWVEDVDGTPLGKYRDLTSDANGNITVEGVTPDAVYTLAVAPAGEAPSDPSTPDIPVVPDQPVNPDQPIIPNNPGSDVNGSGTGTDAGNGTANGGAAASDKGATSPKTGIFA